jgi:hypothetical protein
MTSNMQFTLILGVFASAVAFAGTQERIKTKELVDSVLIKAEVVEINYETREVTLAGPMGNVATLEASEEVERFDEIEVGDFVAAKYMTYTLAEFREPTEEEKENPLVILAEEGKATMEEAPGGAMGAEIRAVVSIELVDMENSLVTIKGPRGNYLTLPVEDEDVLKQVKVGELVVLTYAEAIALSLEKIQQPVLEGQEN